MTRRVIPGFIKIGTAHAEKECSAASYCWRLQSALARDERLEIKRCRWSALFAFIECGPQRSELRFLFFEQPQAGAYDIACAAVAAVVHRVAMNELKCSPILNEVFLLIFILLVRSLNQCLVLASTLPSAPILDHESRKGYAPPLRSAVHGLEHFGCDSFALGAHRRGRPLAFRAEGWKPEKASASQALKH